MSPVAAPVGTASVLYLTESTTTTTTVPGIPAPSPVVQWEDPPSVSLVRNADEPQADSLSVLWLDDRSCVPIHDRLRAMGASLFSAQLLRLGLDFEYGTYTIFVPTDHLLNEKALDLIKAGHSRDTVDEVVLFQVSSFGAQEDLVGTRCGMSLRMLPKGDTTVTDCRDAGAVKQVGPGNVSGGGAEGTAAPDTGAVLSGPPVAACDGVLYPISRDLLLPALPPTPARVRMAEPPTPAPSARVPTPAPTLRPTTFAPSVPPSGAPSVFPSETPSVFPSGIPSGTPSVLPSENPSENPTTVVVAAAEASGMDASNATNATNATDDDSVQYDDALLFEDDDENNATEPMVIATSPQGLPPSGASIAKGRKRPAIATTTVVGMLLWWGLWGTIG